MSAAVDLAKSTFTEWGRDKAPRLGAALAYYAIFSIGPILVVVLAIAGRVFGSAAAQGQIVGSIQPVLGADSAKMIEAMVKNASHPATTLIASIVGPITLLAGAAAIFGQLKDALNTIWEVKPKQGGGIVDALKRNLLQFAMVLGAGLLLLASLVVNAVLSTLGPFLSDNLPGGAIVWQIVNYLVTLAVIAFMFAMVFKFVPDARMGWKEVLVGGAITSVLFVLGQVLLGIYLSLGNVGSAFGAAASLVVILVWIYYSAQILLLGAEFTQAYAARYGNPAVPASHAEFMTAEARANEGLGANKSRKPGGKKDGKEAGKLEERLRTSPWFGRGHEQS
ncbi:MAG: YihY/virulence factor BrkB family protein [Chloroflexota bacterium]|nr:YihY/virulence factor BrkB family protein [Chloroflexota bacterium]